MRSWSLYLCSSLTNSAHTLPLPVSRSLSDMAAPRSLCCQQCGVVTAAFSSADSQLFQEKQKLLDQMHDLQIMLTDKSRALTVNQCCEFELTHEFVLTVHAQRAELKLAMLDLEKQMSGIRQSVTPVAAETECPGGCKLHKAALAENDEMVNGQIGSSLFGCNVQYTCICTYLIVSMSGAPFTRGSSVGATWVLGTRAVAASIAHPLSSAALCFHWLQLLCVALRLLFGCNGVCCAACGAAVRPRRDHSARRANRIPDAGPS